MLRAQKGIVQFTVIAILLVSVFCLARENSASNKEDQTPKTDVIVFSYDRPLQLNALLQSMAQYISGLGSIEIIVRCSSQEYRDAYDIVAQTFPHVIFTHQGSVPHADFKKLTLQAFNRTKNAYIIFAVDDDIITDTIDLVEAVGLLERTQAYGFYFRLAPHLTYCYSMQKKQALPPLSPIGEGVYTWSFNQGELDWAYPNTLDVALYRKKDVAPFLTNLNYHSPNSLEGTWDAHKGKYFYGKGLCYEHTKMVNIPLNKVQNENNNVHMDGYGPEELLTAFYAGSRIDISSLYAITNESAHMPYVPTLMLPGRSTPN